MENCDYYPSETIYNIFFFNLNFPTLSSDIEIGLTLLLVCDS